MAKAPKTTSAEQAEQDEVATAMTRVKLAVSPLRALGATMGNHYFNIVAASIEDALREVLQHLANPSATPPVPKAAEPQPEASAHADG